MLKTLPVLEYGGRGGRSDLEAECDRRNGERERRTVERDDGGMRTHLVSSPHRLLTLISSHSHFHFQRYSTPSDPPLPHSFVPRYEMEQNAFSISNSLREWHPRIAFLSIYLRSCFSSALLSNWSLVSAQRKSRLLTGCARRLRTTRRSTRTRFQSSQLSSTRKP